jgi:flagellar motor switch protein FliN
MMINQATALLIETGKVGRATLHGLRGVHRSEPWETPAAAEAVENAPSDAEQLELWIELGRARLPPDDVQALRKGSVLRLGGLLDEPVAIFAGPRLIGRGQLVVVDGKIGVRVTEIVE